MAQYVALRDRRLEGGVPARPHLVIINTDENTSLTAAFRSISAAARGGKIDTMFILCHGFAGENTSAGVSIDAGGMGLELGRQCLLHSNVHHWTAIRGTVKNIVVYSCAAADTQPNNRGTDADGRYLMGALAIHTNAVVYAADKIQWYGTYKGLSNGAYQWGDWEGKLLAFYPDGYTTKLVARAPTEFADVCGGKS
jgi:hypothetical protein